MPASRSADPLPRTRLTAAFERRVAHALHAHIAVDAPLVVACSGGPDSTAALIAVARRHEGSVVAATFDHGWRDRRETALERAVVTRVADALSLPVASGRTASGSTIHDEESARRARYRWLAAACRRVGAAACVTGHTMDDQAETLLLQLVRGTGARGAGGMRLDAPWPTPRPVAGPQAATAAELHLVRPLLGVRRMEVERYLAALGVEPAHDPSNAELHYARNRIRRQVLPALAEVNPETVAHLAAFAARQQVDEDALDGWAGAFIQAHAQIDGERVRLPRGPLLELPDAVRARVIRAAAATLSLSLRSAPVAAILAVANLGRGSVTLGAGAKCEAGATILELRRHA